MANGSGQQSTAPHTPALSIFLKTNNNILDFKVLRFDFWFLKPNLKVKVYKNFIMARSILCAKMFPGLGRRNPVEVKENDSQRR